MNRIKISNENEGENSKQRTEETLRTKMRKSSMYTVPTERGVPRILPGGMHIFAVFRIRIHMFLGLLDPDPDP